MNKYLLIYILLISASGCSYKTYDYYYISLGTIDDIKITERRKIQLENLKNNTIIPTRYSLSRDNYVLDFYIDNNSYSPHFLITLENSKYGDVTIKPVRDINISSSNGNVCASFYTNEKEPQNIGFGWSSGCVAEDIIKEISFKLISNSAGEIGHEVIPFTLKKDGEYVLLDAI